MNTESDAQDAVPTAEVPVVADAPAPPAIPEFGLKLVEVPIRLVGDDGVCRNYTVKQLNGAQRAEWRQFQNARFKVDEFGTNRCINYIDFEATLIAKQLYGGDGKLVPIEEIRKFPDDTMTELFTFCENVAALGKNAKEEAKND